MAEYHVGCGVFGIYAGTLNKKKTMWQNKSDVTDECFGSVAQYVKQEMQVDKKQKRTDEFTFRDATLRVTYELLEDEKNEQQ